MGMLVDWKCRFKRADGQKFSQKDLEAINADIEKALVSFLLIAPDGYFDAYDISRTETEYEATQFTTESIHAQNDIVEAISDVSVKYPDIKFRMIGLDYEYFAIDFMNGEYELLKAMPLEFEKGDTVRY